MVCVVDSEEEETSVAGIQVESRDRKEVNASWVANWKDMGQ